MRSASPLRLVTDEEVAWHRALVETRRRDEEGRVRRSLRSFGRWFRGTGLETRCPLLIPELGEGEWAILTRVRFGRERGKLRCSACGGIAPTDRHPIVRRVHGGWR